MVQFEKMHPGSTTQRLTTTSQDWDSADPALLESMLVQLHVIRAFEEKLLELAAEGLVNGPAHSSIGQEAAAVGSVLALELGDGVNGTHRGHHQFLAKGLHYLRPDQMTIEDGVKSDDLMEFLRRTLSEILGLAQGFSGGRGGSMHLQWLEAGSLGTNAIVGGGVPLAAGNAWAQQRDAKVAGAGRSGVTVTYFGDGASNMGATLETFNLAGGWDLPLCFFIENNMYAVATALSDVTKETSLSLRGPGFGLTSWQVDGMDPLAVYLAQVAAVEHMRSGKGATLIEAETYRYFHQSGAFRGSAFGYRTKEEEREWQARDPLKLVASQMVRLNLLTDRQNSELRKQIQASVEDVVADLTEKDPHGQPGALRIRPALWPDSTAADDHIRSEALLGELPQGGQGLDESVAREERRFVDVIVDTLTYRMENDESIVVLGEDVHRLGGGVTGGTRGLSERFTDRVVATPISENAYMGLAGGMSMTRRYRPVAEMVFSDFMWVAADQVFNQIAKARHMYGGQCSMPVVLRSRIATGAGYGAQHSLDPSGIFAMSAGWRIVAPSTPEDYIGLLNTALDLDDPVLVLEHKDLYTTKHPTPVGNPNYRLEVGRAAVRRTGTDVTVLCYLNMVQEVLAEAEMHGSLSSEVIDLRWLDRASVDWGTIGESIRRTNSALIVEVGDAGPSYGGWLADEIQRRFFDFLDQPVERVMGGEAPPAISKPLEEAANVSREDIRAGLNRIAVGLGHC